MLSAKRPVELEVDVDAGIIRPRDDDRAQMDRFVGLALIPDAAEVRDARHEMLSHARGRGGDLLQSEANRDASHVDRGSVVWADRVRFAPVECVGTDLAEGDCGEENESGDAADHD